MKFLFLVSIIALASQAAPQSPAPCTKRMDGICYSEWICVKGKPQLGKVEIWWGHTPGDATWACNSWISKCGNAKGGCTAIPSRPEYQVTSVVSSLAPTP